MTANPVPLQLHQVDARTLGIEWADGVTLHYPVRSLRLGCVCAHCVSETTGERLLDPASVPESVAPTSIENVGRYGLRIHWNDGHSTGIYTYERLREWPDALSA